MSNHKGSMELVDLKHMVIAEWEVAHGSITRTFHDVNSENKGQAMILN